MNKTMRMSDRFVEESSQVGGQLEPYCAHHGSRRGVDSKDVHPGPISGRPPVRVNRKPRTTAGRHLIEHLEAISAYTYLQLPG